MKRDSNAILRALAAIGLGTMTGIAAAAECAPGDVEDCFGNCSPADWVGDGWCDDGTWNWDNNPIFLNCPQWDFDDGDCDADLWRPISGMPVPSMAALDFAMLDLMNDEDISAAAMGVMKDGVVVYQRFFGWRDEARTQPLLPDAMFRVASITKPQTAACIRELISDGEFELNDNVFDLGQPDGGLLDIVPFAGVGDRRLRDITVEDCLRHRAGWNRNETFGVGDLTYKEIEIKQAYGQDAPVNREQTVAWILSQPLQHKPGTQYAYSNIGFLVLGLIVEQYAGKDPVEFLHERVLAPAGVLSAEVELGRTLPADRNPSEPWYDHQGATWLNVFASLDDLANDPAGQQVPRPDGGWHQEVRVGQGGLIMTPRSLLKFLDNYQVFGINIGKPRNKATEGPNWSMSHSGTLSRGTNAVAHQWGDGYCFVAMFNKRELTKDADAYHAVIRDQFRDFVDTGVIDVPSCPPNYVQDCNGNCVPAFWLGDGNCDSNTWFGGIEVDFNCEALNFDEGDCTPCPADLTGDGQVGVDDLLAMINVFGMCSDPSDCPADLDGDGFVAVDDLLAAINGFGLCP